MSSNAAAPGAVSHPGGRAPVPSPSFTLRGYGDFLAELGHKARSPLNTILGQAEILQDETLGPLTPPQRKVVGAIHRSGQRLTALVADAQEIAEVSAGRSRPIEVQMVPAHVARQAVDAIRAQAESRRLEVQLEVPEEPSLIVADERWIGRILGHLLGNAVHFTPDGGRVGLTVAVSGEGSSWAVWDTGIGVAAEAHQRIFFPFERVDSELARKHAGFGLGLALVRQLAAAMGGSVSLESELGRGSTFTVRLPGRENEGDGG